MTDQNVNVLGTGLFEDLGGEFDGMTRVDHVVNQNGGLQRATSLVRDPAHDDSPSRD